MITLTEPGIYQISAIDYHADPCPEPSLSGSIGVPLIHRSPFHAWFKHPRLNPDFEPETSRRFDFGTACHSLLFEAGRDLAIIEADNFMTKAAKEARDDAYASGRTPILAADHETATKMADIARARIRDKFGADFPFMGRCEATLVWKEGDAWCRGMVDYLGPDLTMFLDYKTTSSSARPEDAERSLYDLNYHFKAAFYERGLDVLNPDNIGRRRAYFLFQETEAPYECSFLSPSESGRTIAQKQITLAIETWQRCMATNEWPGYRRDVHYAPIPQWLERQWMQREVDDPAATGALAPQNFPKSPVTEMTL